MLKYFLIALLGAFVVGSSVVMAAEGAGQEYVVQPGDWLSKLANEFYADPQAYLLIVEGTNLKAQQDPQYRPITNTNHLEVGQKLFVPTNRAALATLKSNITISVEIPVTPTVTLPTEAQQQLLASLKNYGAPPELTDRVWLNSAPLKFAELHGKVVIIDFWTFGCINCKHVIPSLRDWYYKYKDQGLVIVSIHTPEFGYEGEVANVQQALKDLDVPYPVAIDSDWATWNAFRQPFGQRFWPTLYYVDKTGNVRYIQIGEGGYAEQEAIIQALLASKE